MAYDTNRQSTETRGAMFPRQKKSQNSPDMTGDFVLQGEVLDYVANELAKGNRQIKLFMSSWHKQSRDSSPMLSVAIRMPMEAQQQGGNNGYQGRPQGNPAQRQGYTATGHQPYAQQNANSYGDQRSGAGAFRQQAAPEYGNRPQHPALAPRPVGGQGNQGRGPQGQGLAFPSDDDAPF